LIFGDSSQSKLVRVAEMIDDGELDLFIDTREANPQRQRRVSREQALEIKEYIESK
jgi:hypothetical protein